MKLFKQFAMFLKRKLTNEVELVAAIKVLRQTVMEVKHAQSQGSDWYTRSDSGLYLQVSLHLNKADKAIKSIKSILDIWQ